MTIKAKNEYNWSSGFGASMDIKKVISELNDIQSREGEVTPEAIVKEARKTHSELHNYFEWNNTKAADKYRLQQAAELIQRIEVKVIKDGEAKTIRAFEIVNRGFGEKAYAPFDLTNGLLRSKEMALTSLKAALYRVNQHSEFSSAIPSINRAIKEISKVSTETIKKAAPPVAVV